jgi:outer membrane protein
MKNIDKKLVLSILLIILKSSAFAQKQMNWYDCIDYALQNSTLVKQTQLQQSLNELGIQQSKYNFTPSINASLGQTLSFGRSLDFSTYQFVNQTVNNSNYALTINQPIFEGLRNINSLEKAKLDLQASLQDILTLNDNITLSVLVAYLNVLNAIEQKNQYSILMQNTVLQLESIKKMIAVGYLAANATIDLEKQQSSEQQQYLALNSQVAAAYAAMKSTIGMSPEEAIEIEKPDIDRLILDTTIPPLQEVIESALAMRSDIKSMDFKVESAKKDISIAKSYKYPSISFFTQIGTNFSNQFMDRVLDDTIFAPIGLTAVSNEIVIGAYPNYVNSKVPFFKQLNQNLNYAIGINVNIPIYNKRSAYLGIKRSMLNVENTLLQKEQLKLDIKNRVNESYLKTVAAKENMKSIMQNIEWSKKAYQLAKQRLEKGVATQQEVNLSNNAIAIASIQLIQAKFEYLFNRKVLDYYLGKKIEIN